MLYVFLILTALSSFASTSLDQRLQGYIKDFKLQPLNKPIISSQKLFSLGQSLFGDRALSGNNNISCAECHHPLTMTVDALPLALGEGAHGLQSATSKRLQATGKIIARNTPALFNLDGIKTLFWDGRVSEDMNGKITTPIPLAPEVRQTLSSALAAQAIFPIADHLEMRGAPGSNSVANAKTEKAAWELVVKKLMTIEKYKKAFAEIYPDQKINIGHVGEALAEFQRVAFFRADTAYDDYLRGNKEALSEVQKIGMDVFFGKGKCGECHQGAQLSNFEFHNIGIGQIGPGKQDGDDYGRFQWDKGNGNLYAFRVPPLRNVGVTAPYMHNGTLKTIPQVVEHYDMIIESLTAFRHVNNWKNYTEKILDHDHSKDDLRIDSLSEKLSKKLFFEEEEEKALSEFLQTALTDKNLLAREIDGNYETYLRMQLRPSGFEKLAQAFQGKKTLRTYYYFDAYLEGGYFLRELAEPIRLFIIKDDTKASLIYREEAFKSAIAENGVVLGGVFQRAENKTIASNVMASLENAYLDMFNRIYAYNDGVKQEPIPVTELSLIKADLQDINEQFHHINFNGADNISDKLNQQKDEVVYVPTSYNLKEEIEFKLDIDGQRFDGKLMESTLRTATGAVEKTFALELYSNKISKAVLPSLGKKVLSNLSMLNASDVGGGSPSPSHLTIEIINQVMGE